MSTQREVIVKDGCYVRRTTTVVEENLGPQPKLTDQQVQRDLLVVPDAFSINIPTAENYIAEKMKMEIPLPCHIGVLNTALHVAHRMPYWPLFGSFVKGTESEFDDKGEEKTVNVLNYMGNKGEDYRIPVPYPGLWMVYAFAVDTGTMRLRQMSNAFLITNIRGQFFAPLFPNVFDNAKICLGQITLPRDKDIRTCVVKIFENVFFSRDNDHLMNGRIRETLRFRESDKTWLIPDGMKRDPRGWHQNRNSTVAAEMLQHLQKVEEGEKSPKFKAQ